MKVLSGGVVESGLCLVAFLFLASGCARPQEKTIADLHQFAYLKHGDGARIVTEEHEMPAQERILGVPRGLLSSSVSKKSRSEIPCSIASSFLTQSAVKRRY